MALEIRVLGPSDDAAYTAFLDQLRLPGVLGYHYPFYRDMLAGLELGTPLYLGAFESGQLVGALPGFLRTTAVGSVYNSMPFFGPNAGVLCAADARSPRIHKALLEAALEHLRQARQPISAVFYTPLLGQDWAGYEQALAPCRHLERVTQYLSIAQTQWDPKIHYDLRRAAKLGLRVGGDILPGTVDSFYEMYQQNCRAVGIPIKPRACIDRLMACLGGPGIKAYFAYRQEEMIGGLLVIRSRTTVSYYLPCTLENCRTLQPGTMLIDQAFQDARADGLEIWNWEASPSRDSGVYRFKKKWGSRESAYRLYVRPMIEPARIAAIGLDAIRQHFPYFFVFPFDWMQ